MSDATESLRRAVQYGIENGKRNVIADLAPLKELFDELDLWKPMTPAEAEKALNEAESVPLSDERIAEIVERATDPAETLANSEQAQLAAKVIRLAAELAAQKTSYAELWQSQQDLATDCREAEAALTELRAACAPFALIASDNPDLADERAIRPVDWVDHMRPIPIEPRMDTARKLAALLARTPAAVATTPM